MKSNIIPLDINIDKDFFFFFFEYHSKELKLCGMISYSYKKNRGDGSPIHFPLKVHSGQKPSECRRFNFVSMLQMPGRSWSATFPARQHRMHTGCMNSLKSCPLGFHSQLEGRHQSHCFPWVSARNFSQLQKQNYWGWCLNQRVQRGMAWWAGWTSELEDYWLYWNNQTQKMEPNLMETEVGQAQAHWIQRFSAHTLATVDEKLEFMNHDMSQPAKWAVCMEDCG